MPEKVVTLGFSTSDGQYLIREVNEAEFVQFYLLHYGKLNELGITPTRKLILKTAEWLVTVVARATFHTINRKKGGRVRGSSGHPGGLKSPTPCSITLQHNPADH